MSPFPDPDSASERRFFDDSDLDGLDNEDKPIERGCSGCGRPYQLSIAAAAEIEPGSQFDICDACLKKMSDRGRRLLQSDRPVMD